MADNLKKRRPQHPKKINVSEGWELEYWAKKFNVTHDRLKAAVQASGPSVTAVKKQLAGQAARTTRQP